MCKTFTLLHTETVLFVRNHKGKITVRHTFLYQRVCTQYHIRLPTLNLSVDFPFFPGRDRTGQKNGTDIQSILFL